MEQRRGVKTHSKGGSRGGEGRIGEGPRLNKRERPKDAKGTNVSRAGPLPRDKAVFRTQRACERDILENIAYNARKEREVETVTYW